MANRRKLLRRGTVWSASLAAVLLLGACGIGSDGMSPESLSEGRDVYQANCSVCHGPNGEGQTDCHVRQENVTLPPPTLKGDDHTWHYGDGILYEIVSRGGAIYCLPVQLNQCTGMPAFGDSLSHGEFVSLINDLRNLWRDKMFHWAMKREFRASVGVGDHGLLT